MTDPTVLFVLHVVVFGMASYRVTRFLIEDTLIEGPRKRLLKALTRGGDPDRADWPLFVQQTTGWRLKLLDLVICKFCLGVWVAAAATFIAWPTVFAQPPGNWFVWWLAAWMAIDVVLLICWKLIEDPEH